MSTAPCFEFEIRQGSADDVDSIMSVMKRAFDPLFGEAWTRSQCLGILPLSGVRLTLACSQDRECLGFSLVRTILDEAELLLLAVDPETQRRGVGSALIEDFIHTSRSGGATHLHLEVRDGNHAMEAYRHFGFEAVGRRAAYYTGPGGKQFDALTLQRVL